MNNPNNKNQSEEDPQTEAERDSRQTGGDAPAAGSMREREAIAEDRDALFDDDAD